MDFLASILTHTSDPRTHIALGNIPPNIASSVQTLLTLVSPINWLFAGSQSSSSESVSDINSKVSNGFELTG